MAKQFYLRDTRSNTGSNASFWKRTGSYTTNLNEAEIFTEEEALRQHKCRETDLPVAVEFVTGKTRQRVDFQDVISGPLFDSDKHVVVFNGRFDGNDILFVGNEGRTFNFEEAAVFELEEACELAVENSNYRIYPYEDIKAIVRLTVDAAHVQPKTCAEFAGFTLVEPPKYRKPVYRCFHCGVFMSECQFYGSNCRKCGASNQA
ncbi:hypothetical protein [Rheinheimera aquimaris]|uniref:hypothetical protein n=1 Tax=Rheinheimera aquimaris TaxID=412437 RepID=UPI003A97EAC6